MLPERKEAPVGAPLLSLPVLEVYLRRVEAERRPPPKAISSPAIASAREGSPPVNGILPPSPRSNRLGFTSASKLPSS